MTASLVVFAATQVEHSSLQLKPRVMPHLFCCQLVGGLVVQTIRLLEIAHFEVEISEPRDRVPRAFLLNDCFVLFLRDLVTTMLKIQIAQEEYEAVIEQERTRDAI